MSGEFVFLNHLNSTVNRIGKVGLELLLLDDCGQIGDYDQAVLDLVEMCISSSGFTYEYKKWCSMNIRESGPL